MKINILGNGQIRSSVVWVRYQFRPFDPVRNAKELALVQNAVILIGSKSYGNLICNTLFNTLPGKLVEDEPVCSREQRSFDKIYNDNDVWISYMPGQSGAAGYSDNNKNIAVTDSAFAKAEELQILSRKYNPVEFIASVIVHEMAHLNGATDTNNQAESFLLPCGFSRYYDKT
jgi:hypothetical protein